jgi:O-antigen ligase
MGFFSCIDFSLCDTSQPFSRLMSILAATLLALAVLAAQVLHGGLFVPAFSLPSDGLLVLAAAAGLWVVARNSAPASPISLGAVVVLMAYLMWRCAHATDYYLARVEMGLVLAGGTAFALGYGALTTTRARFTFYGIVLVGAATQAVVGFFQFAKGELVAPLGWFSADLQAIYVDRFATRAHGLFVNPNQFAWLMGWGALSCVALAAWARVSVIARVILIYLALMFVAADLLSGSRGGLLSLVVGGIAFGAISIVGVTLGLRRGRGLVIAGAVFLVALCVGFGWFIYSSNWVMQGRMDALLFPDVRNFLLEHAQRQFEATPLLGTGPGTFIYAARLYRTGDQPFDAVFAHDDWLQTLVEYGFVGIGLALLVLVILLTGGVGRFLRALRRRTAVGDRPLSNAAGFLLAAMTTTVMFAVHSFTDFNMHIPANALLAGATLGILAGTGGEAVSEARRLPAVLLRLGTAGILAILAGALGVYAWWHGPADFYSLKAANAYAGGRVAEGLAAANAGLSIRPGDAQLQTLRGRGLYDFESAAELALPDNGVGADVKGPDGEMLTPEKRHALYEGASEAFSAAIAQRPMERALLVRRANARVETGQREQAGKDLIAAIRLDPSHAYAYGAYGDFLYEEGQLGRALRIYSLGAALPGGSYCGRQAADVREEMGPTAAGGGR